MLQILMNKGLGFHMETNGQDDIIVLSNQDFQSLSCDEIDSVEVHQLPSVTALIFPIDPQEEKKIMSVWDDCLPRS